MINQQDFEKLNTALHFFHVNELRELTLRFDLSDKGDKRALIERIKHFIKTGEAKQPQNIPPVSRAKRGIIYPLSPETLMLKGAYKNDLARRKFFKSLIGDYFHFTAFGIDWLNERWLAGNPPTYREFADMWQKEYAHRKTQKAAPKKEWAYINFTQKFIEKNPNASRETITAAWEVERRKQVAIAREILADLFTLA